jgi:uncharacterized membrane protein
MRTPVDRSLDRWVAAKVIDLDTAERIRRYEETNAARARLRWPTLIALSFGGLMLAAGVLLFVAAHWDTLSPGARFTIVLAVTAAFHLIAAAVNDRFRMLARVLHGVGTACLGGGIFLAAQIFNLNENWASGVLLWAIGAAVAWVLLRDWIQGALTALLIPAWIVGEWTVRTERYHWSGGDGIPFAFLFMTALVYFTAMSWSQTGSMRRALLWIGGIGLLPLGFLHLAFAQDSWGSHIPTGIATAAVVIGTVLPILVAAIVERRAQWEHFAAGAWVVLVFASGRGRSDLILDVWAAVAAIALVAWGIRDHRGERINLGVAAFGLTLVVFYFSNVMDKLGRSISLIGLGVVFLLGGYLLEQTRRRLVAMARAAGTGGTA